MSLEVHVVSDVERSKEFYQRLGWRLEEDVALGKTFASSSSRPRVRVAR
jgi:hypothetical protein